MRARTGPERSSVDERARRVRDVGVTQALLARIPFPSLMVTTSPATALVYGRGGVPGIRGVLNLGVAGRPDLVPEPPLRAP